MRFAISRLQAENLNLFRRSNNFSLLQFFFVYSKSSLLTLWMSHRRVWRVFPCCLMFRRAIILASPAFFCCCFRSQKAEVVSEQLSGVTEKAFWSELFGGKKSVAWKSVNIWRIFKNSSDSEESGWCLSRHTERSFEHKSEFYYLIYDWKCLSENLCNFLQAPSVAAIVLKKKI